MSLPRPRTDLSGLEGYHSPQLDVAVRLNTNESPYPPPPEFVDAWLAGLRDVAWNRYPDRGAGALRARVGDWLGHPAARVFCANGSNEVLQTLLLAYGGAGRRALVFEPTYALHTHIARITGTEVVEGERTDDFTISSTEARMLIEAEHPAVVFVCSPNNPTGTVESRDTIEALLAALVDHPSAAAPGLLVVDEAYGEFAGWSALELVADDLPLVVVRTYSKIWSLAALRLGYAVGPAPVVEVLDQVVLPYHLSVVTQVAGETAIEFEPQMQARVAAVVEERARLVHALGRRPGLTVLPSGANFVLVRFDGDAHALWERLVARGVLVRDFSRRPRLEGSLRITVGTPAEDDRLLEALDDALMEVPR